MTSVSSRPTCRSKAVSEVKEDSMMARIFSLSGCDEQWASRTQTVRKVELTNLETCARCDHASRS
jgi:hypothetical protein